jgi:hypothetical protein
VCFYYVLVSVWVDETHRPWTLGVNETTSNAIMEAVHSATNPLTALGITSSYQNEGDAFETNWQQGEFFLLAPIYHSEDMHAQHFLGINMQTCLP